MNKEKLIQNIKDAYGIAIARLEILRDGSDNIIWDVTAETDDRYAIRVSKRDMGADIAFEAKWIHVLEEDRVPVVPLVRTKTGNSYINLDDGQAVTVFKFLSGRHIQIGINSPPPRKAIETATRALVTLHNASKKHVVNLPRRRTVFTELERVIEYQELISEKTPDGKGFIAEVTEMLKWGTSQSYTPVLVHNDYRIGNIMFDDGDNLLAILDFDWSCMGPAIKDVAHSLAEWSFPDGAQSHSEEIFSTFLGSYNQSSKEPINRDATLYRWIALSCLSDACTFLVDRLLCDEIKPPLYSYMYKKYRYFLKMA